MQNQQISNDTSKRVLPIGKGGNMGMCASQDSSMDLHALISLQILTRYWKRTVVIMMLAFEIVRLSKELAYLQKCHVCSGKNVAENG